MNLMHVDDIAAALPVIFNKAEPGKVYLGVDDEPFLQSEFYRWLAASLPQRGYPDPIKKKLWKRLRGGRRPTEIASAPAGPRNDRVIKGKRCSNRRLKELGYAFKYPTFREGYAEILNDRKKD